MLPNNSENERVTARVSKEVRNTLSHAASIVGATLNQFLVQSALEKAKNVIEQEQVIALSSKDSELFFDLIENPPQPNNRLQAAMYNYKGCDLYVESGNS